ncbi:hypothetical protein IFM89_016629 [Coptis chinensis]|uniref:Uncharacterized protein n=1 Tax=Coptis chinensis TaxID=261450 RepID=A0A835INP9_9MAGN|nr:hypothetical protein IFM89_016629 [Coptis chinensis]
MKTYCRLEMEFNIANSLYWAWKYESAELRQIFGPDCNARSVASQSIVRYLPGFTDGPLPFELETGYVRVDDINDVQYFYYFIKSENKPTEDPLLLWITGGPGCSVLTAVAFEIGPLYFRVAKYNGSLPTLMLNPNSWTKVANIIFLDAPSGTGFSYSTSLEGSTNNDTKVAQQIYTFIRKWLIDHPQYLSNSFYLGGDSYSGKLNPMVVQHISDGIEAGQRPHINLKGYLLGNPVTDPNLEANSKIPYAYDVGFLSDELFESVKRNCAGHYVNVNPSNAQCNKDLQAVSECTSGINPAHILEPKCLLVTPKPKEVFIERRSLNENSSLTAISPPPSPEFKCRSYGYMIAYYWANDDRVQTALNIRKGRVKEWIRCNYRGVQYIKNVETSTSYHFNISKRGYRSLIYSGDHDMLVPHLSTQAWIKSLNYSISDEWRPWFVNGQVGGYTRTYTNNMTFATGGGHTAPEYQPKECFAMFKRWVSDEPL